MIGHPLSRDTRSYNPKYDCTHVSRSIRRVSSIFEIFNGMYHSISSLSSDLNRPKEALLHFNDVVVDC